MVYVGIDYHKSKSSICVLDQGGQKVLTRQVKGYWHTLAEEVAKIKERFGKVTVCFEASGGGGHLHDVLREVADKVVVANPSKLRLIYKSKRKNDKSDAHNLAKLLLVDLIPTVHIPAPNVRERRAMVNLRGKMVSERTSIKNQIRSLLHNSGVIAPRGLWRKKGLDWLRQEVELPRPAKFRLDLLLAQFEVFRLQLLSLEKELNRLARKDPRVSLLMTIPGVGVRTAEALVVYIDDPFRFHRKAIGPYLGLIPSQYQTANQNHLGHITKQGPSEVRRLLVEASWIAIRRSKTVRAKFDQFMKDDPEDKKIAIVAVAHYLARVSLALLRGGECWMEDEERLSA